MCLVLPSSGTEPTCQGKRPGFNPWVGEMPWRRAWQPTPVFLPGDSHGQRSLAGYTVCRVTKSQLQLKWLSMCAQYVCMGWQWGILVMGFFFFLICLQRKSTCDFNSFCLTEASTSLNVTFLMFGDFHCFANCSSFLLLHNNSPSKPRGFK